MCKLTKVLRAAYLLLASAGALHVEGVPWGQYGSDTPGSDSSSRQQHNSSSQSVGGRQLNSANGRPSSYDHTMGCQAPRIRNPTPQGVPIPPLPAGQRPNFIFILTDDQAWDDIGVHNPEYVNTPNLDKFLGKATKLDNFYVTPHCSGTRSSLLTGRSYPRTGVMLVHGGYDYIDTNETLAAQLLKNKGYSTAHFGKWHNANVPGYEPQQVGFEESWYAPGFAKDLLRRNGVYLESGSSVQTGTYSREDILMDELLGYLKKQEHIDKPFFVYYAPHAIHYTVANEAGLNLKGPALFMPSGYKERYLTEARYQGISDYTLSAWAMLEYLDTVLGRLFTYLESSPHRKNTYIMIAGDNGADMTAEDLLHGKELRMPSLMQGAKHEVLEGGIRNFLAVQGPGVQAGVIDSTLSDVVDIVPTMADLAGIGPNGGDHLPWDGVSLKNLLVPPGDAVMLERFDETGRRYKSLATQSQIDRMLFSLNMHCWDSDAVPRLAAHRNIARPQQLIDYEKGGHLVPYLKRTFTGFQPCIGVRYRKYKWIGMTGKVYRFERGSHIELPCNEVTGRDGERLATLMADAARQWWQSVMKENNSFTKPTFFLGTPDRVVTNVVAEGAYDRTEGNIKLMQNGAKGFQQPGDKMCWKTEVASDALYDVIIMYTSQQSARFKLAFGANSALKAGTAQTLNFQLPAQKRVIQGRNIGTVSLRITRRHEKPEACLELVDSETSDTTRKPVFTHFGALRIIKRRDKALAAVPGVPENDTILGAPILLSDVDIQDGADGQASPAEVSVVYVSSPAVPTTLQGAAGKYSFITTPLELSDEQQQLMLQQPSAVTQQSIKAASSNQSGGNASGDIINSTPEKAIAAPGSATAAALQRWKQKRIEHRWPAGQGVFQDMWSPYEAEGIEDCLECQPDLA